MEADRRPRAESASSAGPAARTRGRAAPCRRRTPRPPCAPRGSFGASRAAARARARPNAVAELRARRRRGLARVHAPARARSGASCARAAGGDRGRRRRKLGSKTGGPGARLRVEQILGAERRRRVWLRPLRAPEARRRAACPAAPEAREPEVELDERVACVRAARPSSRASVPAGQAANASPTCASTEAKRAKIAARRADRRCRRAAPRVAAPAPRGRCAGRGRGRAAAAPAGAPGRRVAARRARRARPPSLQRAPRGDDGDDLGPRAHAATIAGAARGLAARRYILKVMPGYRELLAQLRAEIDEIDARHAARELAAGDVRRCSSTCASRTSGTRAISPAPCTSRAATSSRGSSGIVPDRDTPVVLYCASGNRSRLRREDARASSATPTSSTLAGGFADWKRSGFDGRVPDAPRRREQRAATAATC